MDGCDNTDVEDCINGTVQVLEFTNLKTWLYQSFNFHLKRLSFHVQKTKYKDELLREMFQDLSEHRSKLFSDRLISCCDCHYLFPRPVMNFVKNIILRKS